MTVDVELHESLVEIFTQAVMKEADLPEARQDDVQEASTFSSKGGEILCTCDITGSTYSEPGTGPRPQRRPLRRKWVKRRPPWLRARRKTTSTPGSTPAGSPPSRVARSECLREHQRSRQWHSFRKSAAARFTLAVSLRSRRALYEKRMTLQIRKLSTFLASKPRGGLSGAHSGQVFG